MKTPTAGIWVAFLAALSASASPAPQAFRVELFSNQTVKNVTFKSAAPRLTLCGAKGDGPCLTLPPAQLISCSPAHLIDCRTGTTRRTFKVLTLTSASPFQLAPQFASGGKAQAYWLRNVRVTAGPAGLQLVTKVDLESYVSGVLRGEGSIMHTGAARQAMAIVARTWALRRGPAHRGRGFDFCSLTHCLVFRLPQASDARAADAMDPAASSTQGQLLLYHGVLADTYFTACCGGVTEAAGNVWPDRAQPYLGSFPDRYCLASVHASWRHSITAENLERALREGLHLPISGPLTELGVAERDSSGRALVVRVAAGETWQLDANQFRYAVDRRLGWQQIKSGLYEIQRQGNLWIFTGHGLGHGVGLCQAGAEQMARMGASASRILSAYFPGTEVGALPAGDHDPVASSEHFELVYMSSQEPWVKQTLDTLEHWRRELGAHAEVLPPRVRVETWATVQEFIRSTGEPGWMAGSSDGQSIALQPLELLARKGILQQTLRHELTHLVVHKLRSNGVPRWFEEGCVLYFTGERIDAVPDAATSAGALDQAISMPRSEAQMRSAYAQALERVRGVARRQGEAAVWRMLERPDARDTEWLRLGR